MPESPIHCPSCSVRVPEGTGKFCPACGELMAAEPRSHELEPPQQQQSTMHPGFHPDQMAAPAGPVGGPLDPSSQDRPSGTSEYFEMEESPVALPIALGAAGALVGALLWAGIAYATGWEIGYVAWLVGGLVGGGCVLGGGRGPMVATAAAVLAFGGMIGGRLYGTSLLIDEQIETLAQGMTPQAFEQMKTMARELASDEIFAAPGGEFDLSPEDLEEFRAAQREMMLAFEDPSFTFERWRHEAITEIKAQISLWDILKETFDFIDVLFVLLGLSTAAGMVAKASGQSTV